jgi:hypothetical protein
MGALVQQNLTTLRDVIAQTNLPKAKLIGLD